MATGIVTKPNLQDIFGPDAAIVTGRKLTIDFDNFASVGWNSTNDLDNPEKWLTAILLRAKDWYDRNKSDLPNVVIEDPKVSVVRRIDTMRREFVYEVKIYEPYAGATRPDPDFV